MSKEVRIVNNPTTGEQVYPQTHEKAVIGLQDKLDTKANTDGFYESMGVGTAVNLAGQIERTNDMTYRTSGGEEDIATGTARIEKVSGNTVVWNQFITNGNFESTTSWAVSSDMSASLTVANNVGTFTLLDNPTNNLFAFIKP